MKSKPCTAGAGVAEWNSMETGYVKLKTNFRRRQVKHSPRDRKRRITWRMARREKLSSTHVHSATIRIRTDLFRPLSRTLCAPSARSTLSAASRGPQWLMNILICDEMLMVLEAKPVPSKSHYDDWSSLPHALNGPVSLDFVRRE